MQEPQIEAPTDLYAPGAIQALIAFNRSLFGDARMELEDEGGTDEADESQEDEGTGSEDEGETDDESTEGDGTDDGDDEGKGKNKLSDLPEWAQTEIKNVRSEAANWRTKFRELEGKLADAKTPEEVQKITKEYTDKIGELEHQILRGKVGRKFDLPDDIAELLKGDTEEELTAHAKKLQTYVGKKAPTKLKGGMEPNGDDDDDGEMDPRKLAQRARRISF